MIPRSLHRYWNGASFVPFILLGAGIFAFTSSLQLNYWLKGYLVLLEAQAGIVILAIAIAKLRRSRPSSR